MLNAEKAFDFLGIPSYSRFKICYSNDYFNEERNLFILIYLKISKITNINIIRCFKETNVSSFIHYFAYSYIYLFIINNMLDNFGKKKKQNVNISLKTFGLIREIAYTENQVF